MSPGPQTVLIVDDDPQIVRLVRAMLAPQNVRVLGTQLPAEALRLCEEETIDVLISDVAMPGMSGHKLAERVARLNPRVAILLISGAVDHAPAVRGAHVLFLKKPFFPADLVHLLRQMLAGRAEHA